jgi:hypothetical protein
LPPAVKWSSPPKPGAKHRERELSEVGDNLLAGLDDREHVARVVDVNAAQAEDEREVPRLVALRPRGPDGARLG